MREFIAAFVRNRVLANVLLLIIVVVGVLAAFNMVREFFPEISMIRKKSRKVYPAELKSRSMGSRESNDTTRHPAKMSGRL